MAKISEEYYTPKELADLWKMSISFIRKEIREGRLTPEKYGKCLRFTKEQVIAYIEKFCI